MRRRNSTAAMYQRRGAFPDPLRHIGTCRDLESSTFFASHCAPMAAHRSPYHQHGISSTMRRFTLTLPCLLLLVASCVAQRAATSLGMKQNKQQQQPPSSTSFRAGEFFNDIKADLYSFTVLAGLWVVIMIWNYNMEKEGESSYYNHRMHE